MIVNSKADGSFLLVSEVLNASRDINIYISISIKCILLLLDIQTVLPTKHSPLGNIVEVLAFYLMSSFFPGKRTDHMTILTKHSIVSSLQPLPAQMTMSFMTRLYCGYSAGT